MYTSVKNVTDNVSLPEYHRSFAISCNVVQFSCSLAKLDRIQNDDQNFSSLVWLNGQGRLWKVQVAIECLYRVHFRVAFCRLFCQNESSVPNLSYTTSKLDSLETIWTCRSNLFSKGKLTWKSPISLMFSFIVKTLSRLRATNQSSNFHIMANLLITWRYLNKDRLDHSEVFLSS